MLRIIDHVEQQDIVDLEEHTADQEELIAAVVEVITADDVSLLIITEEQEPIDILELHQIITHIHDPGHQT